MKGEHSNVIRHETCLLQKRGLVFDVDLLAYRLSKSTTAPKFSHAPHRSDALLENDVN